MLRPMSALWLLCGVDVCSGVGVMLTIAIYAFPGLFLIIPHASQSSAVSGSFYPALMAIVAAFGCLSVLVLWLCKLTDPGYLPRLVGPLDESTSSAIAAQPDSFTLPLRRKTSAQQQQLQQQHTTTTQSTAADERHTDAELQQHPDRHATANTHRELARRRGCGRLTPSLSLSLSLPLFAVLSLLCAGSRSSATPADAGVLVVLDTARIAAPACCASTTTAE